MRPRTGAVEGPRLIFAGMVRALAFPLMVLLWASAALAQQSAPADKPIRIVGFAVNGNKVTKERIILRELLVRQGDTLPQQVLYDRLERSRQNLMNTGLFNTVAVLPLFVDMEQAVIEVTVHERWTIWPAPIFQLADPNFNTWWRTFDRDPERINFGAYLYKYNFRGRNETVFLKAQFGYARQFGLRYKVPGIDRRQRWGISIGASYTEQAEVTAATLENRRVLLSNTDGPNRTERKADAELSYRRAYDVRHYLRIGFVQADVRDTVNSVAPDYFNGDAADARFLILGYGLTWDRRDSRAFTIDGHYAELRVDRYGIGVLDDDAPDVTTAYGTVKKWWPVGEKLTLAASARAKHTWGTPPYYVQEGLGYANHVRGYEYYVVDGEHFALGKANVLWQLFRPRLERAEFMPDEAFRSLYLALYLNLFADVGRVWDSRYADANPLAGQWLSGYGAGLDLVTSYDQMLRVEYAFNALGEHGLFLHFRQPF